MRTKLGQWTISTLYKTKDKINEQPAYQRGEVWNDRKNSLLIDSILRGIDLPKIYLRKLNGGMYEYEVADGQQRINALTKFIENDLKLLKTEDKGLDLKKIGNENVGGLKFNELPYVLKQRFEDFKITIAIIEDAQENEIRTLFGRLQEGEPLTPAEKRNAIISKLSNPIDNFALNHKFFENCKIPPNRYKRQDYIAHILALIFYENKEPLKADLLLKMYLNKSLLLDIKIQKKIAEILDVMHSIDQTGKIRIYRKYHFIDLFWLLYKNYSKIKDINIKNFIDMFEKLEVLRMYYYKSPKTLIEKNEPTQADKNLYEYIISFRYNGADPESISKRNRVLDNMFLNSNLLE